MKKRLRSPRFPVKKERLQHYLEDPSSLQQKPIGRKRRRKLGHDSDSDAYGGKAPVKLDPGVNNEKSGMQGQRTGPVSRRQAQGGQKEEKNDFISLRGFQCPGSGELCNIVP